MLLCEAVFEEKRMALFTRVLNAHGIGEQKGLLFVFFLKKVKKLTATGDLCYCTEHRRAICCKSKAQATTKATQRLERETNDTTSTSQR